MLDVQNEVEQFLSEVEKLLAELCVVVFGVRPVKIDSFLSQRVGQTPHDFLTRQTCQAVASHTDRHDLS